MNKDKSLYFFIFFIIIIYFTASNSKKDWLAWIYIDNAKNISRIYIGSYDDLNKCRYESREYIKSHLNDALDLKFSYVCGERCDADENNCKSRFSSGYLKYPPDQSFVNSTLTNIQGNYDPEFLTDFWLWKYWFIIQKGRLGFSHSPEDQQIIDKYINNYLPFEWSLNQYSDLVISNDLNFYQSPREFEIDLKYRLQHPDLY